MAVAALMALALLGPGVGGAAAAEPAARLDPRAAPAVLVMVEAYGCPWCARWRVEVEPAYVRSAEGRFAPLLRRQKGDSDIAFIPNVTFTPTFVLLVRGREVGRILGYPGADLFWMQLAGLMSQAGFREPAPAGAPQGRI